MSTQNYETTNPNFTAVSINNNNAVEIDGDLDMMCNSILDVSSITFCNGTALLGISNNILTVSGGLDVSNLIISNLDISNLILSSLDMSCGPITNVESIGFCNGAIINQTDNSSNGLTINLMKLL